MEDLKSGTNCWLTTCTRVRKAFEEYGCFVAVYGKASVGLQNGLFSSMKELFDLSAETKQRNIYEGMPLKGYVGQRPHIPLHEGLGIDEGTTLEGIQNFAQKMWPNGNDQFWENQVKETNQILSTLHLLHIQPNDASSVPNTPLDARGSSGTSNP
ncbi:probable inactive 2-oxoglutarate-dependent dioxygenase AOP2 [Cajanus cajan]|uniref:probable inactive 2-oxoglutarate-dependent dioxygenase AOP2 n=1 Tax=Cajanus cajan TaxID=3821 RepID=UPI0010FBAFA1|nr:probable inactive 2-oxoglutarate-dependent dioxygenase AOP2 [Cajanus cajan]